MYQADTDADTITPSFDLKFSNRLSIHKFRQYGVLLAKLLLCGKVLEYDLYDLVSQKLKLCDTCSLPSYGFPTSSHH